MERWSINQGFINLRRPGLWKFLWMQKRKSGTSCAKPLFCHHFCTAAALLCKNPVETAEISGRIVRCAPFCGPLLRAEMTASRSSSSWFETMAESEMSAYFGGTVLAPKMATTRPRAAVCAALAHFPASDWLPSQITRAASTCLTGAVFWATRDCRKYPNKSPIMRSND